MNKKFTKVLCALLLFAGLNPTRSFAESDEVTIGTYNNNSNEISKKEISSSVYNTRDNNWRFYGDDKFMDAVGGPTTFSWGIMFPSNTLSEGQVVTKVSFYDYVANDGYISIYFGGTSQPELLIHKQAYTTNGVKDFVEFDLTTPIPLFDDNLWVILSTDQGKSCPAAICKDDGDKNGRWISLDGIKWEDLNAATNGKIKGSWMIRTYIEGGESIEELSSTINIFPNPVKDQLFIETENEINEVAIFDVYGRQQVNMTTRQQVVDVTDLISGVYFVRIKTNEGLVTKRFVKK